MLRDTDPRPRRFRSRAGLAALVLAVHVLAFGLIRVTLPAGRDEVATGASSIAWVTLSPMPSATVEAPAKPTTRTPARQGGTAPAVAAPSQSDGAPQAGIATASRAPAPDAKRDLALRPKLKDPNLPLLPATERQKHLAEKFAHDLAVQNAPAKLPCVMGPAVDPICVALQALHGFSMASYADMPTR